MGFIKYMYLADIFHGIALFGAIAVAICIVALICMALIWLEHPFEGAGLKRFRRVCIGLIVMLFIGMAAAFIVPSRRTMYAVAASYAVQELANGPVSGEAASVLKELKSILRSYSETP